MNKKIIWSIDKNNKLKEDTERAVCFEDIIVAIETGGLLDNIEHFNLAKYPNQKMYVVLLNDYVYGVPYVETDEEIFLKTAYPSRKLKAIYLPNTQNE
jgi:hypothetical protein